MESVNLTNKEIFDLLERHNKLDRELFTKHHGWTYPTKEAFDKIIKSVKNKSVLEIGSGLGLWTRLIANTGVDITAVDNLSWHNGAYFFMNQLKWMQLKLLKNTKQMFY